MPNKLHYTSNKQIQTGYLTFRLNRNMQQLLSNISTFSQHTHATNEEHWCMEVLIGLSYSYWSTCMYENRAYRKSGTNFWATVTSNGSPYATGPLSCLSHLSVTLVYCGQTVGWIKMPLGTEVGLRPGDIVLVGDPASPNEKGHSSRHFLAHVYCGQMVAYLTNCWVLAKNQSLMLWKLALHEVVK